MHQDQGGAPAHSPTGTSGGPDDAQMAFARVPGTVISGIDIGDGLLEVTGSDRSGHARWRVGIRGSARFTFSHTSENRSWLVEANFDASGIVRGSERTMILALCGAVIDTFQIEKSGLFIRSDDGRGIEVPYALNEDGIVVDILPDRAQPGPCCILLPIGPDTAGPGSPRH